MSFSRIDDFGLDPPSRLLKPTRAPRSHQAPLKGYDTSLSKPSIEGADEDDADINGQDFIKQQMPPLQFVCRPWIVEGVCLIVGRPKLGKTTLLRQLARAISAGASFFDAPCNAADVLFLSLEEGKRLMHAKLCAMGGEAADFAHITFRFEWPCGGDGVARLREWLKAHPSSRQRIIVVDSVTRFRDPPDPRTPAFQQDYLALRMLADLCKAFPGLVVLALHHTTKATSDDPVACISGTFGLVAAADNYMVLLRQGESFRLHCGGRMWEGSDSDFELERADGAWQLVGTWNGAAAMLPVRQRQVLDILKRGAKTPRTIAEALGLSDASQASHVLSKLEKVGLVCRVANGWMLVS